MLSFVDFISRSIKLVKNKLLTLNVASKILKDGQ